MAAQETDDALGIDMTVLAVIQARLDSSRLPGKVLMPIAGEPMLTRVVERTARARTLDAVMVATTERSIDDPIVELCQGAGWPFYRGAAEDVLDRYYGAALVARADVVVRVTSDCPLIDPEVIDLVIRAREDEHVDFASNTLPPRTYPLGLDVEVMTMESLTRAWREDGNAAWREHVTPYIYRHPERFSLRAVQTEANHSRIRLTVDTDADLSLVRRVCEHLGTCSFGWKDVIALLDSNPAWLLLNRDVEQKTVPS